MNLCFVAKKSEYIRKLLAKYSGNGSDDDLENLDNSIVMGPAMIFRRDVNYTSPLHLC